MVSVFAIGPKVRRFKAGRERWIFNGDKNRSTSSFGGEVKPSAPRRKILLHVKELCGVENISVGKIHDHFSPSISCFATRQSYDERIINY
jgi:hypothetical protein